MIQPKNKERKQSTTSSLLEEIEASSQYFKPKPGKNYTTKMDRNDKIVPRESDRFGDANDKPIKRYECSLMHVNSTRRQIWSVLKTVCLQIRTKLKEGFTVKWF